MPKPSSSLLFSSLLLLSLASIAVASDHTGCLAVTVYLNSESSGGLTTDLCPSHFTLSNSLDPSLIEQWSSSHDLPVTAEKVVLGNGEVLTEWAQVADALRTESDPTSPLRRLYLVLPGTHFIWPFVHYGYTISTSSSPEVQLVSISDRPRIFRLLSFFSKEESDALVENVQRINEEDLKLQRSSVGVNKKNGKREYSSVRTSKNAFDSTSPTARALMRRSFDVLKMDYAEDQADGLQIVTYEPGEAYISHTDWMDAGSDPNFNFDGSRGGSNRFATIFMYLIAPEEGGQTVFPLVEDAHPDMIDGEVPANVDEIVKPGTWERTMVDDCYSKFAVTPANVSAILFYSLLGDGSGDLLSEHGACPPLKGNKWGANLWVWNRRRHGLDISSSDSSSDTAKSHLEITFINRVTHPIDLLWSDTVLASLGPGERIQFNTYLGHEWSARLRDEGSEGERRWGYVVNAEDDGGEIEVTFGGGKDEL